MSPLSCILNNFPPLHWKLINHTSTFPFKILSFHPFFSNTWPHFPCKACTQEQNNTKALRIQGNTEKLEKRRKFAAWWGWGPPTRWPWDRKNPTKIRLPLNFRVSHNASMQFPQYPKYLQFSQYIHNIVNIYRLGLDSFYCSVCCRVLF